MAQLSTLGHRAPVMNFPRALKFTVLGFSPRRMAYILCALLFALVPLHSHFPCEASEALGGFALMMILIIGGLCWLIPQTVKDWWVPRVLAFIGFVAHLTMIH